MLPQFMLNTSLFPRVKIFQAALLVCLIVWALPAMAQTEGPDQIRIYWDTDFTQYEIHTSSSPDTITGYLVIDQPSAKGVIREWRCEFKPSRGNKILGIELAGKAEDTNYSHNILQVLTHLPIKNQKQVLLATFTVEVRYSTYSFVGVANYSSMSPEYRTSVHGDFVPLNFPWPTDKLAWINTGEPNVGARSFNFGSCGVGYPIQEKIRLTNYGTGFARLDYDGPAECSEFRMESRTEDYMMPPGSNYLMPIIFDPSAMRIFECFWENSAGARISLRGQGREPLTRLIYETSLNYDTIVVHSELKMVFSVANGGDIPIIIDPLFVEGGANVSITEPHLFPNTLKARETLFVWASYSSAVAEENTHYLQINPDFPLVKLALSCRDSTKIVVINPTSLSFLTEGLNNIAHQTISIRNTGDLPVKISPRLLPGDSAFRVSSSTEEHILDPGDGYWVRVDFAPPVYGQYTAHLDLGPDCPGVEVTGTHVEHLNECGILVSEIEFDPVDPGQSSTKFFKISNTGLVPFTLSPRDHSGLLTLVTPVGAVDPGETVILSALFAPQEFGEFTGRISLGPDFCSDVTWYGRTSTVLGADQNQIGFYFDAAFTSTETTISESMQIVESYLVLRNPSVDTGVAGWECRLDLSDGAVFVSWDLEGYFVHPDDNLEFTVGLGSQPLPYSDTILFGAFDILVLESSEPRIALELHSKWNATVPGHMSWLAWGDGELLLPMVTATGEPQVAWINRSAAIGEDLATSSTAIPTRTGLLPNVPNPFNPSTEIRYELKADSQVNIDVYDLTGRRVRSLVSEFRAAGAYNVVWSGRDNAGRSVPSGAYYVRLNTNEGDETRKVLLVK